MRAVVCLLAIGACGRVNFEPITDGFTPTVCGPTYTAASATTLTSKYRRGTAGNWFEAEADCESDGGHLVVIDDVTENAFVDSQKQSTALWIGLTDHVTEGTLLWVTGEPLGFEVFKPDEPNDSGGEDCIHMLATAEWNDTGCRSGQIDYVCECDHRPAAATYCDTETVQDCGECGDVCTQPNCNGQVCGGGGGG